MELEKTLQHYFGFSTFRTGQKEIILDVLAGRNVLAVLPTGSGKSLCYQIPAMDRSGVVLVISPLLSLMEDQVKQLKQTGFQQVIAINSFLKNKQAIYPSLDRYKLIYLSPEILQNRELVTQLKHLNISLFVIDEAHCISQWGHEFRPDYLKLRGIIEELGSPPFMALSATATPEVQEDIIAQLNHAPIVKHIYPMDRNNIAFLVEKVSSNQEKDSYLTDILSRYTVPTMVYFSSKKEAERVANKLTGDLPELQIAYYHGGMDQTDRILIQQQFMEGNLDVICCTSAFGMGIDKSNVRLVVHYHIPIQIESFIQEIGRSGRDGLSSLSIVLYTSFDHKIPERLIEGELPDTTVIHPLVSMLQKSVINQSSIKLDENKLIEQFGLSEIQWRFLHFQLEKHGMIKENRILKSRVDYDAIAKKIVCKITERNRYKMKKLNQMLQWLNVDECRRVALYQPFQKTINQPIYFCCDRCGFTLSQWDPVISKKQSDPKDWKVQLQQLFSQGESQ